MNKRLAIFCAMMAMGAMLVWVRAQDGLVGRWTFDEGGGTNTVDVTGRGNDGVLVGAPLPAWSSGVSSNALRFDGVQNEVRVADDPGLTPTNALTLAAWVKTATNMTSEVITKWSTNALAGSYILGLTNGFVSLELVLGGNYFQLVGWNSSLTDTNWHHIAGSYDGTNMTVYLDAAVTATGGAATNAALDVVTDPLRFGLLDGVLDDARLYDRALSANEIVAIYELDANGDRLRHVRGMNTRTDTDTDGDGLPDSVDADPLNYDHSTPSFTVTCPSDGATIYP